MTADVENWNNSALLLWDIATEAPKRILFLVAAVFHHHPDVKRVILLNNL